MKELLNQEPFTNGKMENKLKSELKNTFTSYWHFLALQKACQLGIFDVLAEEKHTFQSLNEYLKTDGKSLNSLLSFFLEEDYLKRRNDFFVVTEKGLLLTENHPESLKNACILWGEEHLTAWQKLDFTLQTGQPSFEKIYGKPFFDYLNEHPLKLKNYHLAMRDYAKDDYKDLPNICDFSEHSVIADIGGGLGVLIGYIADAYQNNHCILFDLPTVTKLIEDSDSQPFQIIGGSFFEPFPFNAEALILSRVLHDWSDEDAQTILQNCRTALSSNGFLYIIEIMQDEVAAHLLSLNMLAMCKSYERTFGEYQKLLKKAGFQVCSRKRWNDLQTILICQ